MPGRKAPRLEPRADDEGYDVRRRVARVARRYRGVVTAVDRAAAISLAPRLVASGLLDLAWYSTLSGQSFDTPREAAHHYLTVGRRQGLVPNPLFDPSRWGHGNSRASVWDPVVGYLRGSARISPSVLFDPVRYLADHPDARSHRGGPLGHFLTRASAPPLPVTDLVLAPSRSWEEIRPELLDVAARWRTAVKRSRPRRTADYDAARGRATLAAALARPVPVSPDDRPLVSVVIPARDREAQIGRAIASVRAQSLGDWEALVVDDGSTDATPDVVARHADADPRITLVRRPQLGVSAARNAGIAAGRGHYVAFLDTDNRWDPDFLRAMLGEMLAGGAEAAYSAAELDDGSGSWVRNFEGDLEDITYQNHIDLNALVVSRALLERIGTFDESLRRMVDWDLVIRIAQATPIAHCPFVGVHYDDKPSAGRITTRESGSWADAVVAKHEVDWGSAARSVAGRVGGRVSVVVAGGEPVSSTVRTVRSVLESGGTHDVEVLVVGTGLLPFFWIAVLAALGDEPRVHTLSLDQPVNRSVARNLGAAASTGGTILFLDPGLVLPPGWVDVVRGELEESAVVGVQLLVRGEDGTVWSAGISPPTAVVGPRQLHAGARVDDAIDARRVRLDAASSMALALRATTVATIRGFDPVLSDGWADLDLSLRASDARPASFVLCTDLQAVGGFEPSATATLDGSADRAEFARRWAFEPVVRSGSRSVTAHRVDARVEGRTASTSDERSGP